MDKIENKIRLLKAVALRRRMVAMKKSGKTWATEPWLANKMNRSRGAVAKWKMGTSWPSPSEEREMEKWLEVPEGFFEKVASGVPHREIEKLVAPTLESLSLDSVMSAASTALMERRAHLSKADAMVESLQSIFANHKNAEKVQELLNQAGRLMDDYVKREEEQLHAAARYILEAAEDFKRNDENPPQEQKTAIIEE